MELNDFVWLPSVGERPREVPAGCQSDRRRAAHEEVHVGPVLVGPPEVLQVPVYRLQSSQGGPAGQGGGQAWKGGNTKSC